MASAEPPRSDPPGDIDELGDDRRPRPLPGRPVTSIFGFELVPLNRRLLSDTHLVRAVVGLVIGLTVLFWPTRTDGVLAALAGVAIFVISVLALIEMALRRRPRRHVWVSLLGLLLGVGLVVDIQSAQENLGELIGLSLIVLAIRDRPRRGSDRFGERLARSIALTATGLVTVVFPEAVLATATSIVLVSWIVVSAVAIGVALDARTDEPATAEAALRSMYRWFNELADTYPGRGDLADRLTFTGANALQRGVRFYVLMSFASVIASMGVITDSTAVVIGAMLIAPLMTPLMGMALALAMGWPDRLGRAAAIAAGGIALAVLVGLLLGWFAPAVIDTATNSQILSRSQPNALDLIIAVAAGGAGAYGLSRPDVSDALPGVAIAISLVPPLAVTGISYSQGDWQSGSGALLLFGTNAVAILLVGGITFVFTGVVPLRTITGGQRRGATALAAVVALAAFVVGALLLNGKQAATDLLRSARAQQAVADWLEGSDAHRVDSINPDGDVVIVNLIGPPGGVPDVDELAASLSDTLGRDVAAEVRLTIERTFSSSSTDTD